MDPIRTTIMNNRFNAIVEEASAVVYRTAHTTFVKLTQDYATAIATPEGDIFAYPAASGAKNFVGLPLQATLDLIGRDTLKPGDCIITNDPFSTDGLVTHLMDVTMLRPIFRGDELIAVSWSFIHASDIGGAVPGSISPAFTEVFQEGVRLRPMKLIREGVVNEDVKHIILDNSRISSELWGDFEAMISGMQCMDRRLNQLCDRYGLEEVQEGIREVLAYSEQKAREVIAAIPNGTYSFSDYVEALRDNEHTLIKASLTVADDELHLDFEGTDPQIQAAYNFVTGDRTHPYLVQLLFYYILTLAPDTPRNAGLLRPIKVRTRRGSIVNAEFPAAGGSRVAASTRVYDVLMGCLNRALPGGLAASSAGMVGIIVASAVSPITGQRRVTVINPICGGGGARRGYDGVNGIDSNYGHLKSIPAEITEVETVMLVRSCGLMRNSRAPGQWPGGAALSMELENTGIEAVMTVRGLNRFHFRPWGVNGAAPGRKGDVALNPGTPGETSIGKVDVLVLKRGEAIRISTPTGGGFGHPFDRDPAGVLRDVERDLLDVELAESQYGVVIRDGAVDAAATAALRAGTREPVIQAIFDYGPERDAYDHIWPGEVRADLASRVLDEPSYLRRHLMAAVRNQLTNAGEPVSPAALARTLATEKARLEGRSSG